MNNSEKILRQRYFLKKVNEKGEIIEVLEDKPKMFMRVATFVSDAEKNKELREKWCNEFFNVMNNNDFLPNSPCLVNAGNPYSKHMLFACFVLQINDSMESIFGTLLDTALVHQAGGGSGFNFSNLRPKGAPVKGCNSVSSGPISFMKVYNAATEEIKQGGFRRGANMGVLSCSHPDLEDFIIAKRKRRSLNNFNLSVSITDKFMKAVKNDDYVELKHEKSNIVKKVRATYLWNKIITNAWKSGDPGVLFIDTINQFNPIPCEPVDAVNPCGESVLNSYEACNLGSINLMNHIKEEKVDWNKLEKTIEVAVRMLDDMVDVGEYPLDAIKKKSQARRKIGLGVMGLADMLISFGIPYNSNEALRITDKLMKFINEKAFEVSEKLGEEKGSFSDFEKSIYVDKKYPTKVKALRNACVTCQAPTGSISIIAGVSAGIEPNFSFETDRETSDKVDLSTIHPLWQKVAYDKDGKKIQLTEKQKAIFVTAQEIEPEFHVKMQATVQKHVQMGVSKTINMNFNVSRKKVKQVYELAYDLGCKGITVFRDGCKGGKQVLYSKENKCPNCSKYTVEHKENCSTCRSCGWSKCDIK